MTVSRKEWVKPNVKEKKHLAGTGQKGDGVKCGEQVSQHAWDDGKGVENLRDGEGTQEEVHGCVESMFCPDSSHDDRFPRRVNKYISK